MHIYQHFSFKFSLLIFSSRLICRRSELDSLVRDHKTSNSSRSQGSHDAGNKSREGEFRHISTSRGSELGKNTNLNTERADIAKAAASISGNKLRTRTERGVVWQGG